MPAERSKATAKWSNEMQAAQLVWAVDPPAPTEAPTDYNVSLTADMTATTFDITSSHLPTSYQGDDLPPLVEAPPTSEFQFFTPLDEGSPNPKGKRIPHSKKRPENHIPRPPNAFILFRSSFIKSQHVSAEVETNHSTLSKIIGMTWQSLPEDQRQAWHAKARLALQEHRKKFPKYSFRPAQNKVRYKAADGGGGNKQGGKRRVREVEPKDLKRCAKIAELLVEGKKGAELDAAIQEFDRHHVPEIVTRFEAPITARAFRRPSSAPIPETENSKKNQTFLPKSPVIRAKDGKRKLPRATSIQPTRCSSPSSDETADEFIAAALKQEPTMDFSSFSFANVNQQSASTTYDCDPLSPISPVQNPAFLRLRDPCSAPAPLTIPNVPSFLMDDWSVSSSPISPFAQSPMISPFDTPCGAFDNSAFETTLNLNSDEQYHPNNMILSDPSSLSLPPPSYDPGAGTGINMLDMGISMGITDLVTGYDETQYLDLFPQAGCTHHQQFQTHQHQHHEMGLIPSHHHPIPTQATHHHHEFQQQLPHMPNLDMDLTALMASTHLPARTEFVL